MLARSTANYASAAIGSEITLVTNSNKGFWSDVGVAHGTNRRPCKIKARKNKCNTPFTVAFLTKTSDGYESIREIVVVETKGNHRCLVDADT